MKYVTHFLPAFAYVRSEAVYVYLKIFDELRWLLPYTEFMVRWNVIVNVHYMWNDRVDMCLYNNHTPSLGIL